MEDGRKFWDGMEDGMEDFYDGMEMEWKKMSGWKMEKTSSIPFHPMPCFQVT